MTNAVFLALAVIMPLIYSVTFAILNIQYPDWVEAPVLPPKELVALYLVSNYSKGALLAISSIFFGDSIRRISASIKQIDMAQHMNGGIMTAHVLTLVLQLMSLVLYYWMFFYVNRYPLDLRLQIWGLRAWDISVIVNFLS